MFWFLDLYNEMNTQTSFNRNFDQNKLPPWYLLTLCCHGRIRLEIWYKSWHEICTGKSGKASYSHNDFNDFEDQSLCPNDVVLCPKSEWHYNDVIMCVMASQITCVSVVCSTVCSGANIKHPRHWPSWGELPVISPHKGPRMRKMFPFWWHHHDKRIPLIQVRDTRSCTTEHNSCVKSQLPQDNGWI